jgi:hypothetical protein
MWMWGLAVELLLFAIPLVAGIVQERRVAREEATREARADSARAAWERRPQRERDSILAAAAARMKLTGVKVTTSGDTLWRLVYNDSQSVTVTRSKDTVKSVEMSPAAERAVGRTVGPIVTQFAAGMNKAVIRLLLVLAVVYLTIPVALSGVTVTWWLQRRTKTSQVQ